MKKLFTIVSNLQPPYHFKLDFQKVGQYTGRKWLIHGTKRRKQEQSVAKFATPLSSILVDNDTKESEGKMFNPIFKRKGQGWKLPGRCAFAESELLSAESVNMWFNIKKNGNENPNNSHNYHDYIKLKEIAKGTQNDTQY